MQFSAFGEKFTQHSGILQLMDDLGDALKSDKPVNMLGGGNPARIAEVNAVFTDVFSKLAAEHAVENIGNYSNPQGDAALIDANTGFVDCAVDRIVPPVRGGDADPLAVTVEVFSEWIVDSTQFKGAVPAIAGMIATDKLMAFIERKLFTLNTGHTALAYFGQLAGKKTVGEAMQDDAVRQAAEAVMKESGAVLIRRYAFDPAAHRAYIDKILKRFANPYLHDDIDRVARQPLRKLGAQERFIKPLNGMLEYDLPHDATVRAIAATLHYHNPDDPQAVEMQYYRHAHGIAATLAKYSDFTDAAVVAEIEAAYQAFA